MRLHSVLCGAAFILFFALVTVSDGHKILFLAPFPGPSHWLMMKHFIRALSERGHEVTAITAFPFGEPLPSLYNEVVIDPPYPIRKTFPVESLFEASQSSDFTKLAMYWDLGINTSRHGLESEPVRQFISRRDLTFDLILAEQFFQESWLMFAHQYGAPIVTISTYGYSDFFDRIMGLRTPLSFVPHMVFSYEDDMTYQERVYNVIVSMYDAFCRQHYYLPEQDQLAAQAFGSIAGTGTLPSVADLERSISLILVNSHPILSRPRPSIRGLVDIGGAHIRPARPLDPELRAFIDGAGAHGVIYFSLGAYMQSSVMSEEKRQTILRVFASLPQRIIWKFEIDGLLKDVPSNVLIRKWAPQNDILAEKNVRLFISHGGQFGTFETMHHGVPTLFIPFFGDQQRNADRAIRAGFARKMDFNSITEDTFGDNIRALIEDQRYYEQAKKVSALFKDTLVEPMDESIFWIEYVARHGGAPHLKSRAVDLSWFAYYNYDLVVVPLVLLLLAVYWLQQRFQPKAQKPLASKGSQRKSRETKR